MERVSRAFASKGSGYYRLLAHEDSSDEEEMYEVDRAVSKRVVDGEEQMLVTWVGYPIHTASWVPSAHVTAAVRSTYFTEGWDYNYRKIGSSGTYRGRCIQYPIRCTLHMIKDIDNRYVKNSKGQFVPKSKGFRETIRVNLAKVNF
ncbi:uncharacterized protein [Dysidea avara]|uniref:uncharacterized protein isoform X2 n=1 Tax=Dysidea avara TaxID=196820 RepID=UPI003326ABF8